MATGGMLGDLFTPKYKDLLQEERDQEQVHQFQAADPFRAMAHASYSGGTLAGKGLGRVAAVAAGKDPRSPAERNLQAVEAAKQQIAQAGIDPNDTDTFYKAVIDILRKQGLAAEAFAVAREWDDAKAKRTDQSLKERELARKTAADQAKDSAAQERNRIALLRLGTQGEPVVQLLNELDKTAPEDVYKRRRLMDRLAELTKGSKVKVMDLGNRVQLVDELTGELIREEDKGAAPLNARDAVKNEKANENEKFAYMEVKADMQRQIDKSAELHNHPGVNDMTGLLDQYVGEQSTTGFVAGALSSDAGAAAAELWKSIVGGTFLAGLAKLKAASKTGATGLGAVSEREGDKVQSDAAALGRLQKGEDFRLRLRQYIQLIVEGGARLDAKAQEAGVSPIQPLSVPQLSRGGRPSNNPPAPRPAARPAAPSAPAAGGMDAAKKKRLEELRAKRANGTLK